jgi:hypothetical protein
MPASASAAGSSSIGDGSRVLALGASDLGLPLVQEIVLLGTASLERFGVTAHLCQFAEQALDVGRDDRKGLVAAEKALEVWISTQPWGSLSARTAARRISARRLRCWMARSPARDGGRPEDFVRSAHAVTGHG